MNYTGSVRHGVVIRLAELYLIAAEAELFLNDNASGTSYINEVRRRAAIPGKEAAMEIKPEQLTLDFIWMNGPVSWEESSNVGSI